MRHASLPLALVALVAAGCSSEMPESSDFGASDGMPSRFGGSDATRLASWVGRPADGMGIGGDVATAIMADRACGVAVDQGAITYDIALEGARVQDSTDDPRRAPVALVKQGALLRLIPSDNPYALVTYLVDGVQAARLTSETGFVALTQLDGDCALRWFDAHGEVARVALGACESTPDLAVDPETGRAFVSVERRVLAASPGDVLAREVGVGHRVAFDEAHGLLYIADASQVLATADGAPVWSFEHGAPIDHLRASRTELVIASAGESHTALERVSPAGTLIDAVELGFAATDLAVSRSGAYLGASSQWSHAYYALER